MGWQQGILFNIEECDPDEVLCAEGDTLSVCFRCCLVLAAASTTSLTVEAPQQSDFVRLDRVSSSRATTSGLEIHSGGAIMQIIALRDDVLRIRVGPGGALPEDASWAVLPSSRTAAIPVTPESTITSVGFKTAKLHVTVQKDPLDLTVTDMAGHVIVAHTPPAGPSSTTALPFAFT